MNYGIILGETIYALFEYKNEKGKTNREVNETVSEKFINPGRDFYIQVFEVSFNSKRSGPRHIIIKLYKIKDCIKRSKI